jgi:hypothetical protein
MRRLLLTLDTNMLDDERIERLRAAIDVPHEFAIVTVSGRERGQSSTFQVTVAVVPEPFVWGESRWGEGVWGGPIPELFVIGEAPLGSAMLADGIHVDVFESALRIIGGGSFPAPGKRDNMSPGHVHQLRDAMIYEAHVRQRRHVLVTLDAKGFIRDGRRERLERLGATRILSPDELLDLANADGLADLLPPA